MQHSRDDIEYVPTQAELEPLNMQERQLLHIIRSHYRYGQVTIEVREGIPQFIVQTVVRQRLGISE